MATISDLERAAISRRTFLKGTGIATVAVAAGPTLWRQAAATAAPPMGVHLQFGARPTHQMSVSWITLGPVSNPVVRFGLSPAELDAAVAAETRTYVDGLSDTEVFTQHAALSRLRPNTRYHYAVSHEGSETVTGQFQTAPAGRSARFRFTSFGDQGIADKLGDPPTQPFTRYAGLIVPEVEAEQPLFNLLNGDLCYANVQSRDLLRVQTWRSFFENNSRSARFRPWMPCAGNHENEKLDGRPGLDPFKAYQTYFALPDNGPNPDFLGLWYTFRVGSVAVISINNDDVCYQDGGNTYVRGYSGGEQKAWLERTLADARADEDIDWIVVCMHQVAISTGIPFNGCDLGVREEWLPLFDRYDVDLVVCGHEHHYERSFALRGQEGQYRRPVVASTDVDRIDTSKGTVHVVLGGGGHNFTSQDKFSVKDGAFEAEILAPTGVPPMCPACPIPIILPKPRERATWSPTILSADPTASHFRDTPHAYGFGSFDVDPGTEPGGWTTITVRYLRVLDPTNPADAGKAKQFDSFVLRRRRSDGDQDQDEDRQRRSRKEELVLSGAGGD